MMSPSFFLACLLPCLVVCASDRPHILFIMMDDQGYNDIGYTYPEFDKDLKTPLIDGLAHEGLILDRHYTSWLCTPSRASLLTGKYPIAVGIQDDMFETNTRECLNEGEILMPEPIRHNGYATHLIGKWHIGYARWDCMPCLRGFNTALGYTQGEIGYRNHYVAREWHDFYSCSYDDVEGIQVSTLPETQGVYSMDVYAERAINILDNHDPEQPIFLYMPLQTPHSNYWAPEKFYKGMCNDTSEPRCTMQAMLNAGEDTMNKTISKFIEKGMWNNTLLIYISDNGAPETQYNSNWPLSGYKNSLYEGGIRTPGFLYSVNEDILAPRGRTACYVHISDWYSTLVEITGGWGAYEAKTGKQPPNYQLDSIDQSELLITGARQTCQRTEIMVHVDPVRRIASYIKGDFKVLFGDQAIGADCEEDIYYPFDETCVEWEIVQLFNITADVSENNNIADDYPDEVQQLKQALVMYLLEQAPMQCQLSSVTNSFPNTAVPYCLPFDFLDDVIPPWATYALLD